MKFEDMKRGLYPLELVDGLACHRVWMEGQLKGQWV